MNLPTVVSGRQMQALHRAIHDVWNNIGSDVYEMVEQEEYITNEAAIEMCLDADRLAEVDEDSYNVYKTLLKHNSYKEIASYLNKVIDLV
jgi:hypothetical protein